MSDDGYRQPQNQNNPDFRARFQRFQIQRNIRGYDENFETRNLVIAQYF